MEVILNRDINGIGKAGQIAKVKDGFARNFLIPKGLALQATTENLKKSEQEKQRHISRLDKVKRASQELKEKLNSLSLTMPVLTQEEDRLYGSVSAADLAHALKDEGFDVDKDSNQL